MTLILGFDVSQGVCNVAISNDSFILAFNKIHENLKQAEMLIPTIELTLKQANKTYQDLDYITTTNGPGSFTGIRIGLSAAQALSLALQAKIFTITNFELICQRFRNQVLQFDFLVTIVNAYRQESYWQVFDSNFTPVTAPSLNSNLEIATLIQKFEGLVYIAGNGAENIMINNNYNNKIIFLPRFPIPDARFVCRAAHSKIINKSYNLELEPLYIRSPDAKIQ